jgi:hypothetical protein
MKLKAEKEVNPNHRQILCDMNAIYTANTCSDKLVQPEIRNLQFSHLMTTLQLFGLT